MPRFAANLTTLWPELPLLERFAAARAAGFEAVEVLFPYDDSAQEIRDRLGRARLSLVLINGPPPNYAGGPRGFAAVPGSEERFRGDLRRVLRYAALLKPRVVHLMAGLAEGAAARATFVANLRHAARTAPGQVFTIEPINPADMPGYFLADYGLAAEVVAEVGAPNLRLQFDAYHAHRITGDVIGTWARVGPLVGHVQVADHPGRGEPGSGEIDFPAFFDRLDADGYDGWVSAEYKPAGGTDAGLGWLPRDAGGAARTG